MTAFILPQRDENEKIETREKKTIFTKIMNIRDWTFSYFGECVMVKEIRKGFWADAYKVQIKKAGVSMAKVAVYDGDNIHWYSCKEGELLSDVLKREGYLLAMPCAGKGICGKCRIKARGQLSEMREEESRFLSEEEKNEGIRLACMARVLGNVRVEYEGKRKTQGSVQEEGIERKVVLDPSSQGWGAAVDIGTTTMAAYLYRLSDGKRTAQTSDSNPQSPWGADVISRIERALAGEGKILSTVVIQKLEKMILSMLSEGGKRAEDLQEMVITANTAMLYLLTKTDPEELSHAPFHASRRFGEWIPAESLGFQKFPAARAYLPRCASAFVGADITTAMVASGMLEEKSPSLLLDIGTNGEIALCKDGKLICCSTAAGPALEGGNIRMGMPALPGAIDMVSYSEKGFSYTTIGGQTPMGLCGSGLLDATAALRKSGILDDTGAIQEEEHTWISSLCEVEGFPAFRFPNSQVVLTQRDIRNVQLAKGAICAGIRTLLSHAGLQPEDIGTFYLAGGFGSYINIQSAVEIGLIPQAFLNKTKVAGNAAGMGACMLLQSQTLRRESEAMTDRMETVELSQNPLFQQYYLDSMMLEPI